MSDIFHVLPQQENQTVAAALRHWLPGRSWGQIRRLMKGRQVMVSGNLCVDAGRRLTLKDVVKILPTPAAAPPRADDVKIRYLDEHLVVVEKPAGLTSNRHKDEQNWPARRKQLQPTLDELLPHLIARADPRMRRRKGIPPPVRPVHRLDRDTSGLMIFARSVRAERHLGEQFRHHTTHRRYLAIVQGNVQAQTISSRLVRDRGDGRRGSTSSPHVGKPSTTHIRPLDQLQGYTMIECRLETGRTHQIRIHLSEQGHPVCGDKQYHQPLFQRPIPDTSNAPRLALHATELGFVHPMTGEEMRFSMPLPKDLKEFWERLRGE
ncbi:MAG TPA: RluA family pseudouridine synthase [Pirellulales bacterium]|jgi:23S rRNA pseudouridine1911/1915/1917 synthase|nr:RluA family pseudouridine synthase [Pirellulales bacterium]